jgi:tetratricopeptide (TPR) repeat protein
MNDRRLLWTAASIAFLITFTVMWPCVHNDFTRWDDDVYLTELAKHPRLSWETLRWAFTTAQPFYYQPLTWLTHVLDYQFFGMRAAGHHFVSILLHACNAGIAVFVVRMLTGNLPVAIGVGIFFGIHPLQVESVAWMAERKNLLCAFFFLLAVCAYLRGRLWTTTGLGIAALLSKPMGVSLLPVLLVLDYFPLKRYQQTTWRRLIAEKWVLIIFTIGIALITVHAQKNALMEYEALNAPQRALVAVRGSIFYLWKLAWPSWLSPYYPIGGDLSLRNPDFWVPLGLFVLITGVAIWKRGAVLAAWLIYVALVLPVSGLMQSGSQAVADRFAYLPIIAVLVLIGQGVALVWNRLHSITHGAIAVLLISYAGFETARAREQIEVWTNEATLWRAVLTHYPKSGVANLHMAHVYLRRGEFLEAQLHAEQAARVFHDDPLVRATLGAVYLKTRRYDDAAVELQAALQLESSLPAARYNLACAYAQLGRYDDSWRELQQAIQTEPSYATLAMRDGELARLRKIPEYARRLEAMR